MTPPVRARRPLVRLLAAAGILGILPAGAACGAATATRAAPPTVVASFYPWAWLTRQIAGQTLKVQDLTQPGVDPHDVELTARQIVDIERARLVVYVEGIQPAVDEAVRQHAHGRALDAASVVDVLPSSDAEGGVEAARGAHGPAAVDPHIWLDPARFAEVADSLGNRLAGLDPAHATQYQRRTARLVATLHDLDEAYRSGLRTCRSKTIVTNHASFGYLADRYGLEQVGVAGVDSKVEPSPARLARVARLIEAKHVDVVFLDPLASSKAATTLARETGARTTVLDPIGGLRAGSAGDYLSLMRANLSTLREALGCS